MELSDTEKETVENIAENNKEATDLNFIARLKEVANQVKIALSI